MRSFLSADYTLTLNTLASLRVMKLDRANEQEDTWLADDPAFPAGSSGIKQEICRRIWSLLLVSDWVFNSHAGRPSIPSGSCEVPRHSSKRPPLTELLHIDTTPPPLRVNDEDLGRSLHYSERPAHELTDVDFITVS